MTASQTTPHHSNDSVEIIISLPRQRLYFYQNGRIRHVYPVSTASAGWGEQLGSGQTPRGRHIVRALIGKDMPLNTVFVARRPTGEIWTPELAQAFPGRDWILTRILWLSGCEPSVNRLANQQGVCDTMRRFIYIHGCPDGCNMDQPGSHGCVRMRNRDIVHLFDRTPCYTRVLLSDS